MFERNQAHSEITSAPHPIPSTQTYPTEKKDGMSAAEMGVRATDTDSASAYVDPKGARDGEVIDAVWGRIDANGPNYRNLGW
jgi:hypothetical protein